MKTCMCVCWSTVWFCGAYSPAIIDLTSEETILPFNTQAYFGLGDAGIFHLMVWCQVSGRFKTTSFLANFLSSFRVFGAFFIQSSLTLNLWPKFVLVFLYPYATPVLSVSCIIGVHVCTENWLIYAGNRVPIIWKCTACWQWNRVTLISAVKWKSESR